MCVCQIIPKNNNKTPRGKGQMPRQGEINPTLPKRLQKLEKSIATLTKQQPEITGSGKYSFGKAIRDTIKYVSKAKSLAGMGSYSGAGNTSNLNQLFTRDDTDVITINHSEFLADVTPSSSNFGTVYSSIVNPGLSGSFPWLSQIAQYYEEYWFEQLVYSFKTSVAPGNSNASGSLIFATQYNPTNSLYTSKQVMENAFASNSFSCAQSGMHGVECDPTKSISDWEYVRTGAVPSGQDPKSYDKALFQLAASGCYAGLTVGELWVTYKIKLRKIKLLAPGQVNLVTLSDTFKPSSFNTAGTSFGNDSSVAIPDSRLPYTINYAQGAWVNNLGLSMGVATVSTVVRNELVFPYGVSGRFLITLQINHAAGVIGTWDTLMTTASNASNGPYYANCTLPSVASIVQAVSASNNSGDIRDLYMFLVDISGNPSNICARVRFPGFTITTGTDCSVCVAQVPTNYRLL